MTRKVLVVMYHYALPAGWEAGYREVTDDEIFELIDSGWSVAFVKQFYYKEVAYDYIMYITDKKHFHAC